MTQYELDGHTGIHYEEVISSEVEFNTPSRLKAAVDVKLVRLWHANGEQHYMVHLGCRDPKTAWLARVLGAREFARCPVVRNCHYVPLDRVASGEVEQLKQWFNTRLRPALAVALTEWWVVAAGWQQAQQAMTASGIETVDLESFVKRAGAQEALWDWRGSLASPNPFGTGTGTGTSTGTSTGTAAPSPLR